MNLRRSRTTERPGLVRTVRIDRRVDQLVERANPGDIAVIDVIDLDRGTAEQLIASGVSAVVNASASCSGRFPVNGAKALLEAGVLLVDGVGGEVFSRVRDGDTVRLEGGAVYAAGERVVDGDVQSDETVAEVNARARLGMSERLTALVADAGRLLAEDDGRLLEGDGFPVLVTGLRDRVVVVLTAGTTEAEIRTARGLVRRRNAVLVTVGSGTDIARAAGLRPDLVVVGRSAVTRNGCAGAREVLVLDGADLDSPIPTGTPRARSNSFGSADDTAVLLAHTRGAALVVTLGLDESLGGLLDRSGAAGSMPFVSRLRDGGRHITATAATTLVGAGPRRRRGLRALLVVSVVGALVLAASGGMSWGRSQTQNEDVVAAEARADTAEAAAVRARAFETAAGPVLVADRLRGHVAQVVVLPGAGSAGGLVDLVKKSGASVSGPVVLGDAYVDPARARVLRDLAVQLAPAALRSTITAQPAATPPAAQLDQILATALAVPKVSSVGGTDAGVTTLLSGLNRLDGLAKPAAVARAGDVVVLVVPARSDTETTTRTTSLVSAFARRGAAVVVVANASPANSDSDATGAVGALRDGARSARIATVDDGSSTSGRVSTVLALDAILRGLPGGDHGRAADANGQLLTPTGTAPQP